MVIILDSEITKEVKRVDSQVKCEFLASLHCNPKTKSEISRRQIVPIRRASLTYWLRQFDDCIQIVDTDEQGGRLLGLTEYGERHALAARYLLTQNYLLREEGFGVDFLNVVREKSNPDEMIRIMSLVFF